MRLTDITLPRKLEEWLEEFKRTKYYEGALRTYAREKATKTLSTLHDQYEGSLWQTRMGRIWMHLYDDASLAMDEILNLPPNPPFDKYERNDFCCTLCLLMETESRSATPENQTAETFPRQMVLDYVSKANAYVSSEWKERVLTLWNKLMDEEEFVKYISKSRDKSDIYNKYKIHSILGIMYTNRVYNGELAAISMALADGDNNLVKKYRSYMSKGIDDNIKSIVKRYISET